MSNHWLNVNRILKTITISILTYCKCCLQNATEFSFESMKYFALPFTSILSQTEYIGMQLFSLGALWYIHQHRLYEQMINLFTKYLYFAFVSEMAILFVM